MVKSYYHFFIDEYWLCYLFTIHFWKQMFPQIPGFFDFHQVEVETTSGALLRSRIRAFRGWLSKVFTPEFLVPF